MLIRLSHIGKSYRSRYGKVSREVLNDLILTVEQGEKIAIVGPSGSGKTTLLNIMGMLDKPDTGEVWFDGRDVSRYNQAELAAFRNREIGFVFQFHHLLPQLTLWENVLLPTLPSGKNDGDARERAERWLRRTGIWDQRLQKPAELSGGECQRAAVVRALINEPRLLLADEPTGALDEENARSLGHLLTAMNRDTGITLIVVTHSMELARTMDRVYLLKHGNLSLYTEQ